MEISEIRTAAPAEGRAAVELETFALLDRLHIPYAWVAHETADTIADCDVVSEVLGISICKNLFFCNRQKTAFYLLTMPGGGPILMFYFTDFPGNVKSFLPQSGKTAPGPPGASAAPRWRASAGCAPPARRRRCPASPGPEPLQ